MLTRSFWQVHGNVTTQKCFMYLNLAIWRQLDAVNCEICGGRETIYIVAGGNWRAGRMSDWHSYRKCSRDVVTVFGNGFNGHALYSQPRVLNLQFCFRVSAERIVLFSYRWPTPTSDPRLAIACTSPNHPLDTPGKGPHISNQFLIISR